MNLDDPKELNERFAELVGSLKSGAIAPHPTEDPLPESEYAVVETVVDRTGQHFKIAIQASRGEIEDFLDDWAPYADETFMGLIIDTLISYLTYDE